MQKTARAHLGIIVCLARITGPHCRATFALLRGVRA